MSMLSEEAGGEPRGVRARHAARLSTDNSIGKWHNEQSMIDVIGCNNLRS